ncbi:MAG: asparaginase [Candidatus Marinimicrobia bacterium]|nr:asparaginase [Candidatus Neomarinimicrobiota bacterium]MCF7921441.1 asparaginase [Candidatus Neomarinimicrobiota bacterium]
MKSLITQVTRSGYVESYHVGYGVIVDAKGGIVKAYGDSEYLTYVRSSAKPMQGMAVLRSGAYDNFKLTPEELAVICSSHSGQPIHIKKVLQIFSKAGIGPELLACGIHPPIHRESAQALEAAGLAPQQMHNNCSGKHVGMLATCVQLGFDPRDYLNPDHPVQQYIYDIVKEYTSSASIHRGVDGCSAPVFYLPLQKVALAFARISQQGNRECRQIFQAMNGFPHLVGGQGRFDTALMESYPERIMSKGGAEAVSAAGFMMPNGEVYGLAVKVLDGNYRAIGQMVLKMLEDIGFVKEPVAERLMTWWKPELKNHAKRIIGTTNTIIAEQS